MTDVSTIVMDVDALNAIFDTSFSSGPTPYHVTAVTERGVEVHYEARGVEVRPGGTISGPTMMALADGAAWMATLARIGPVLLTVTSSLQINFLAKPLPGDLFATAELLRLGKRQSVTEVRIYSGAAVNGAAADGETVLVAQATVVYAIPAH